jgi:hypothetical protein
MRAKNYQVQFRHYGNSAGVAMGWLTVGAYDHREPAEMCAEACVNRIFRSGSGVRVRVLDKLNGGATWERTC